jgi:hypothetical protein
MLKPLAPSLFDLVASPLFANMPSSQQYQALPVEEKPEVNQSRAHQKPRWSKLRIIMVLLLSFLVSCAFVLGAAKVVTRHASAEASMKDADKAAESLLKDHLARQSDNKYLLGVGKADITGYAFEILYVISSNRFQTCCRTQLHGESSTSTKVMIAMLTLNRAMLACLNSALAFVKGSTRGPLL